MDEKIRGIFFSSFPCDLFTLGQLICFCFFKNVKIKAFKKHKCLCFDGLPFTHHSLFSIQSVVHVNFLLYCFLLPYSSVL